MSDSQYDESKVKQNCMVAFLDILGFKDIFKSNKDNQIKLVNIMYRIKQLNTPYNEKVIEINGREHRSIDPDIISFSDHIILVVPEPPQDPDFPITKFLPLTNFSHQASLMTHYVSALQIEALLDGFSLRGAISYGNMYIDCDNSIFIGDPLIEAIECENRLANYPRVILTESLISHSEKFDLLNVLPQNPPHETHFKKDFDGLYYVDFLSYLILLISIAPKPIAQLKEIRNIIKHNIGANKNNLKLFQKWFWLGKYFDDKLEECHVNNCLEMIEKINLVEKIVETTPLTSTE